MVSVLNSRQHTEVYDRQETSTEQGEERTNLRKTNTHALVIGWNMYTEAFATMFPSDILITSQ
jgi:hypothetical protein